MVFIYIYMERRDESLEARVQTKQINVYTFFCLPSVL